MSSPFGKAIVIANARAGAGKVGSNSSLLSQLLDSTGLEYEIRTTEDPGYATQLATQAIEDGYEYLIAVGGDGTIHEVVNGMMNETGPIKPGVVLGIIPGGSGSDFCRTFGLPREPEDAVKHLSGDNYFVVDAGRVTYQQDGVKKVRYFANIAEAGLGGEVCRRAARLPRFLGRVRYLLSFWLTLGRFQKSDGRVFFTNRTYEGNITNLVVANAQFFGGGMRIAPKAHPGDGKFDVLVQKGTKRDYVAGITKVFRGEHLPSPAIKEFMDSHVEVETNIPLQIEADGEVLGFTPATFDIVSNAYRLKI